MSKISREFLEEIYSRKETQFVADWSEFLRFKSISADPTHEKDCIACAEWLQTHLGRMGFETELLPTNGKPVVYGEWKGTKGAPTVVYYGHYDVQPVDPLDLWKSDPFNPTMRDGRLYARGAQDNKGQTAYFLKAVETLIEHKALTCNLRVFIEGEEEVGSKGIAEAIPSWGARLKGDVLMVCDTGLVPSGAPTITMGLRGLVKLEATLTGPKYDLHSGVHGGVCRNPAAEIARLVASLHNPDGSIAVKGFYDSVTEVSEQDKKLANEFQIPPDMYAAMTGVLPEGGERKFSVVERRGFRPTIEVNGIYSGYMGAGSKTIIPSKGTVKLSSRIVGGQNPEEIERLIIAHLKAHTPKGVTLEISDNGGSAPALLLSSKSKPIGIAREVLDSISTQKTVHMWEGASVPIVASLWKYSGAEPVLVGFGKEEDQIHAPNESFSLSQFKSGFLYAALFLNAIQKGV